MKVIILILLLGAFSAQADVGFKQGNDLTAVLAQGEIAVRCQSGGVVSGPLYGRFRCQEDLLLTGEYDYFQGPTDVAADEVTVTAFHPDGSQRTKTVGYDSTKGQSSKRINLWIATLLQRPLLDVGSNRVSYRMTRDGKVSAQGEFIAVVKDGGKRICSRRGTYWSNNSMDCQTGGSFCSQYFRENNYCL